MTIDRRILSKFQEMIHPNFPKKIESKVEVQSLIGGPDQPLRNLLFHITFSELEDRTLHEAYIVGKSRVHSKATIVYDPISYYPELRRGFEVDEGGQMTFKTADIQEAYILKE